MTDRNIGKETHVDDQVELVTTPCHRGGVRWWFRWRSQTHIDILLLTVNETHQGQDARKTGD